MRYQRRDQMHAALWAACSSELAGVCLQDRHTILSELLPDPSEPWAASLASIEQRGFAAIFDGHKRSESAETARHRLHKLLAK